MKSSTSFELRTYVTLPPELVGPLDELDTMCFRRNYVQSQADHTDQDDKYCSRADMICYVLVLEQTNVVGEARVFKRVIEFDHQTVVLGGIGSVGTHPDNRQKGVASMMIQKTMKILREHSCDVVYLCTDTYNKKLVGLYEHFGFLLLDKPHTYVGKSGKRYTDIDGMLAPVCSQKLFQMIVDSPLPLDIGVGNW